MNIEEDALLCSILLDNAAFFQVCNLVEAKDFSSQTYSNIYSFITKSLSASKPVDVPVLLSSGFDEDIVVRIKSSTSSSQHAARYAQLVRDKSQKRQLLSAAEEITEMVSASDAAPEVCISEAEKKILAIRGKESSGRTKTLRELTTEINEIVNQRMESGEGFFGDRTGIDSLDQKLGGLQKGETLILAGRPSMGKSSVATQIILNRAEAGGHCLFFSLEMSHQMCGLRLLSQFSGIPMHLIKTGQLLGPLLEEFNEKRKQAESFPIWINDTGAITVPTMRSICRRVRMESGRLDLVCVDYLQLCGGTTKDGRERDVAEASAGLKAIAKEFEVPVIILSQLNRSCESREDKRPLLSDLRESGAIEQDADAVLMVYRDAVYSREADPADIELIIRKNRNGPLGTCGARWNPETMNVKDSDAST